MNNSYLQADQSAGAAVDLRSDTVTQPCARMRKAMATAEVGDDVYGDDPTVHALEAETAERLGHEAGLFLPSGTQSNLAALLTHCQRGDEYLVGELAHTYRYEGGGASVLGGIQPQWVPFDDQAAPCVADIEARIKPDDVHFARTRLVSLENTHDGRVVPIERMEAVATLCRDRGLALHLDGARLANAAVALGVEPALIAQRFDSVSLCLSKGLGAPVGSVLVGSRAYIHEARRWRKVLGGGMRQAGVLAAAGRIALQRWPELAEDHEKAQQLASALSTVDGLTVREGWTQTNMVWVDYRPGAAAGLAEQALAAGYRLSPGHDSMRLVLHRDVPAERLQGLSDCLQQAFAANV